MSLQLRTANSIRAPRVGPLSAKQWHSKTGTATQRDLAREWDVLTGQLPTAPAPIVRAAPSQTIVTRASEPAPIVRAAPSQMIVTQAQPLQPFTPPPPIVAAPTTSPSMSLSLRNAQTSGPGLGAGIKTVIGAAIGAGVNWATGQIGSGRGGSGGGGGPPSIPIPSSAPMPGGGVQQMGVQQMGASQQVGRVAGAMGALVGKNFKRVRGVVAGVLGWWLVDRVTGNIVGPAKPPTRRVNYLNQRALRRADRRIDGFVKIARKALSSTGFTVKRRESGRCAPKRKKCR